jgi:hypothetical protein
MKNRQRINECKPPLFPLLWRASDIVICLPRPFEPFPKAGYWQIRHDGPACRYRRRDSIICNLRENKRDFSRQADGFNESFPVNFLECA